MADQVFNIAKGRVAELHHRVDANDPTNAVIVVVLLKVAEADATLIDYDTLGALLAGSNTEADFTNYARKVLSDSDITSFAVDDTNNRNECDLPDQTWTAAGGASNNTLVKAIICYDPDSTGGTDAELIPLVHQDFAITTNGGNITQQFNAAGYFRAS